MSPYIVTTNRGCDDAECNPNCRNRKRTRRAVATLEEARHLINSVGYGHVNESGGTVGPLPDGTVIEVESLSPLMLMARTPGDRGALAVLVRGCLDDDDFQPLLDAFNEANR